MNYGPALHIDDALIALYKTKPHEAVKTLTGRMSDALKEVFILMVLVLFFSLFFVLCVSVLYQGHYQYRRLAHTADR